MEKYSLLRSSIGAFLLLASGHGLAQQSYLGITGVQASSESSYAFLGAIVPFKDAKVGQGPYYKAIASWLRYEYDTTLDNRLVGIEASAPGIEFGYGYAWTGENYGIDLSAAVGYRNMRIRPVVPPDEEEGDIFTLSPQVQARYEFTPSLGTDLIASYTFGQETYFDRLRFGWKPTSKWRTGVEGVWQGGPNHRIQQQGVFVVKNFDNGLAADVSVGRMENRDGESSGYAGLVLVKAF